MEDLLGESVDIDLTKDKIFTSLKDKTHSMYKKITSNLKGNYIQYRRTCKKSCWTIWRRKWTAHSNDNHR